MRTRICGLALAILVVPACLGGCGSLQDLLKLDKPTAEITGVSLSKFSLDAATLLFDVEVDNPYGVPLPLVNLDYALASKGAEFLTGKADIQGAIPANGRKTVGLPAEVKFLDLLKAVRGVRAGSVVPYAAELGLSVDAPALGELRLPLRKEGKLPVPAAPEVSVAQVNWEELTLERAGGRVKLALANRNEFPIELSKFKYGLSLAGVEVADSSIQQALLFPAAGAGGGPVSLEIPISFSPKQAGMAVLQLLAGDGGSYQLNGVLDVNTPFGPLSMPLSETGRTVFKR